MSTKDEIENALGHAGEFLSRNVPHLRSELAFFEGEMNKIKKVLPSGSIIAIKVEHALQTAAHFESGLAGLVHELRSYVDK